MTRPSYHPHPRHFYEDKHGTIHLCDGSQIIPGDVDTYIVWTLCEKMDVPADKSFTSNFHVADCIDCRRRAGLQL
jgi:hypothetical protein